MYAEYRIAHHTLQYRYDMDISMYRLYMYCICNYTYICTFEAPNKGGGGQFACVGSSQNQGPDAGLDATCSAWLLGGFIRPGARCHMFTLVARGPHKTG